MQDDHLEPFVSLIRASHLIDDAQLNQCLTEFIQQYSDNDHHFAKLDVFKEFLISRSLLTRWQCDKLSAGKYKGFYLEDFVLLDHLGTEQSGSLFSARDRRNGETVTLEVTMPAPGSSEIRYQVR
jgi:hypothetical protein